MSNMTGRIANTNTGSMTCLIDGVPYTVDNSHPEYVALTNAFHNNDADFFLENWDVKVAVQNYVKSAGFEIKDDKILFNGVELHSTLVDTILALKRGGHPVDYMVKFLENVMKNPSYHSRQELFDFLSHKGMPLTEDGCFMAYKAVNKDFYSKTSGTMKLLKGSTKEDPDNPGKTFIYNGVGEEILCDRGEVDDNRRENCSNGLHVGAYSYSGPQGWFTKYANKIIIVKVNPELVVCVPTDHDCTKMRVQGYTVVEEFVRKLDETVYGRQDNENMEKFLEEVDEIFSSYEEEDDDCYDEDECTLPSPWDELCVGDKVRGMDHTGRIEHEFYLTVTDVDDNSVTLDHMIEIYDYEAEDKFILLEINGEEV